MQAQNRRARASSKKKGSPSRCHSSPKSGDAQSVPAACGCMRKSSIEIGVVSNHRNAPTQCQIFNSILEFIRRAKYCNS
eukprot:IDg16459t1